MTVTQIITRIRKMITKLVFLFTGFVKDSGTSLMRRMWISVSRIKPPRFLQVKWCCPPIGWHKCNTDGAAAGVFRNNRGFLRGSFVKPLGQCCALHAELMAFVLAVEIASKKNWFPVWFESDSQLLVRKVKSLSTEVPWKIKNKWKNCLQILDGRNFIISHIHREGNAVADALANEGFGLDDFTWCIGLPEGAQEPYHRNL